MSLKLRLKHSFATLNNDEYCNSNLICEQFGCSSRLMLIIIEWRLRHEFLKQICFGLNTPEADKRLVISIVSARYEHVQFVKVIRNADADTGVRAVVETSVVA